MKTIKSTIKVIVVGLILILSVGCSPQTQSWFDSNLKWKVGTIPADVCVENGKPQVLGMTSESDGDVSLVYLRNDGAIVLKHYPLNITNTDFKEGGEFYFTGGVCLPDGAK